MAACHSPVPVPLENIPLKSELLVYEFSHPSLLGIRHGIYLSEVALFRAERRVETENIASGDKIDDARWCKTINLMP